MVEALILAAIGACFGVAWASLATYLGSFLRESNVTAMLGIRAAFLTIALFVHGYVRSSIPRLFIMVLLMILPVLIGLVRVGDAHCTGSQLTKPRRPPPCLSSPRYSPASSCTRS